MATNDSIPREGEVRACERCESDFSLEWSQVSYLLRHPDGCVYCPSCKS